MQTKEEYLVTCEHLLQCAYVDIVRIESIYAGDIFLQKSLKQHETIEDYDMCIIIRDFIVMVELGKLIQQSLREKGV